MTNEYEEVLKDLSESMSNEGQVSVDAVNEHSYKSDQGLVCDVLSSKSMPTIRKALKSCSALEELIRNNTLGHMTARITTDGDFFLAHYDGIGGGKGKETYVKDASLFGAIEQLKKEVGDA